MDTQKTKSKMMALPEGVHNRLSKYKQPREPFYSVISRLMDAYDQHSTNQNETD